MVKTNYTSGGFSSQGHRVKGSEIFVGGFPRSVTESIIHELFSPYGEIIELRMIKDQEGNSKGFCFVRFTTKEAAFRAYKENDGVMVHGKSIRVALSSDQDSLFFGNLHKDWSLEEFDKLVRQAFKDVLSVNLAMYPSAEDFAAGKRRLNRGFAFVQFSSHAAAARAYRIGSKADFLLAGKWHPVIDWAEKEPEIDPEELSKIKAAFIGNLPNDADEEYLKKLFDPLGKVERVALSRKGHFPVGFVHFAKRADLDNAIKEMDGKIVQGPRRGPKFKIQVAVARPVEMGKRPRDEPKNKPLPRSRDQSDSSYDGHISDSLDHKSKAPRLADQVPDTIDPYEAAVITLPAVVKEHLLQVLRVGIATRYDLNLRCITSLRELSESAAIAVLDQFMLSGADRQDKGAYFASLVSKHQAEKFGQRGSTSYVPQKTRKMFSLGARLCSEGIDLPKESELLSLGAQLCSEEIDHSASRNRLSPALFPSSSSSSLYDRPLPSQSSIRKLEDITPSYRVPASSMRYGPGIGSSSHLTPKEHPVERRQMKFDPFTGEPYKYDPFTGEPIKPEPHGR